MPGFECEHREPARDAEVRVTRNIEAAEVLLREVRAGADVDHIDPVDVGRVLQFGDGDAMTLRAMTLFPRPVSSAIKNRPLEVGARYSRSMMCSTAFRWKPLSPASIRSTSGLFIARPPATPRSRQPTPIPTVHRSRQAALLVHPRGDGSPRPSRDR